MFAFKYLRSLSSVLYRRGFPWLWNRTEINRGAAPYRELLKRRLSYKAGRKNTRDGRLPSWKSIGPGIAISEILLNWNYPNMNRPDSIFSRYFIKHLYVVNRYPDDWKYGEKKKVSRKWKCVYDRRWGRRLAQRCPVMDRRNELRRVTPGPIEHKQIDAITRRGGELKSARAFRCTCQYAAARLDN